MKQSPIENIGLCIKNLLSCALVRLAEGVGRNEVGCSPEGFANHNPVSCERNLTASPQVTKDTKYESITFFSVRFPVGCPHLGAYQSTGISPRTAYMSQLQKV